MKKKFLTFLFVVALPVAVVAVIYFNLSKNSTQANVQTLTNAPTTTGSASTSSQTYSSTQQAQSGSVRSAKSTRVS